jgi:hypothetical protein
VDVHAGEWANLVGDLVDDAEEAVAGADQLHEFGLRGFVDFEKLAGGGDHFDSDDVGADLAELAGEGCVLGAGDGGAAGGETANLGVDVELIALGLEGVGHVEMNGSGLDDEGVGADADDLIHLHADEGSAVGSAAGSGGVVGADRTYGRRIDG